MAHRKMPASAEALATFIAQLTETDQLSAAERASAKADRKRLAKKALWLARLRAVAAWHFAEAASKRSTLARIALQQPDSLTRAKLPEELAHERAAREMIVTCDVYFAAEATTRAEAAQKIRDLADWRAATWCGLDFEPTSKAAWARWTAAVREQATGLGLSHRMAGA